MNSKVSLCWSIVVLLLGVYLADLIITKWRNRKRVQHLLFGDQWYLSKWASNLVFAGRANNLLLRGYHKFKDTAFQILRGDGSIVLLPSSMVEELALLPPSVASPHGALEHDLLGPYTGLNLILESRIHHTIVQRKLTPRLPLLAPHLEEELTAAMDEIPAGDEWNNFQPYQVLAKVSARLAARALVGPQLCYDHTWLDISVNYTENLFRTIVILRLFPSKMHGVVARFLPSFWACHSYLQSAKQLLSPKIQEMISKNDQGLPVEQNADDFNVLSWLVEAAKGGDRDAEKLSHVQVLLALASVHTTLLRMVNVLYDLTANPQYLKELRSEIDSEVAKGWCAQTYPRLEKLDSVLRESQRMSPPTILGMKRLFRQDYTFSNGIKVSAGTYACMPTYAIENDPQNTVSPHEFQGLRSYDLRKLKSNSGGFTSSDARYIFTTPEPTVLNFGYGKTACPGRYFASLVLKMVIVKLITEYDFEFMPGEERPKNIIAHEFLFCWPWQKMRVRSRRGGACPF